MFLVDHHQAVGALDRAQDRRLVERRQGASLLGLSLEMQLIVIRLACAGDRRALRAACRQTAGRADMAELAVRSREAVARLAA